MLIKLEGKNGHTWRAGYRDPTGKQVTKVFRRKADAEKWLITNRADIHRGEWIDPADGRKTVEQVFTEMHAGRKYSPKTIQDDRYTWGRHIPDQIRRKPIANLKKSDVDKILDAIEGDEARRKARLLISRLFNSTDELQRLPNPAKQRKVKATRAEMLERKGATLAPKTYLSTEELARLLEELPPRYRMVVEIIEPSGSACVLVRRSPCASARSTS